MPGASVRSASLAAATSVSTCPGRLGPIGNLLVVCIHQTSLPRVYSASADRRCAIRAGRPKSWIGPLNQRVGARTPALW